MSAPAVIAGDFSTFKHVQGRKVLQLVIEVPAEAAASVFSAFGYPGTGSPIPVAVARLVEEPKAEPRASSHERKPFTHLPYATQASLRCREKDFWRYLSQRQDSGGFVMGEDAAAEAVRNLCAVDSRAGLIEGTPAAAAWEAIEADYFAWQRGAR